MKRLRVLHVIESLGHGGAEQNLLSVIRRLPRDRYEHHLAWLYEEERLADAFRPLVDSLVPLGTGHGIGNVAAALALARWMRRHRPDLVHAQLVRAQLVARAAALLGGRPPVVTTWQNAFYHERAVGDFVSSRRRGVVRVADAISGRIDRHYIAVSDYVAVSCASALGVPSDRVSVVYNAVEPERYAPQPAEVLDETRRSLDLPKGARLLLCVGRLVGQKNQAQAIEAMPAILRAEPNAVLLIAGAGPLAAELRSHVAARTLGDRVRLLGSRRDVAALYQLADLFLFPSRYEGLSVALVEALANGLPAVVSDIPQNREAAGSVETVRYVPLEDPERLAQATLERLRDSTAKERARRDAPAVRDRFAPEGIAAQLDALFRRAVGGPTDEDVLASARPE